MGPGALKNDKLFFFLNFSLLSPILLLLLLLFPGARVKAMHAERLPRVSYEISVSGGFTSRSPRTAVTCPDHLPGARRDISEREPDLPLVVRSKHTLPVQILDRLIEELRTADPVPAQNHPWVHLHVYFSIKKLYPARHTPVWPCTEPISLFPSHDRNYEETHGHVCGQ